MIRRLWQMLVRWRRAASVSRRARARGWHHFGQMLRNGNRWSDEEWERQFRYSNRLYRLGFGTKGPWKPHNNH